MNAKSVEIIEITTSRVGSFSSVYLFTLHDDLKANKMTLIFSKNQGTIHTCIILDSLKKKIYLHSICSYPLCVNPLKGNLIYAGSKR